MKNINWRFLIPVVIFWTIFFGCPRNQQLDNAALALTEVEEEDFEVEIDSIGYDDIYAGDIEVDKED